MGGGWGTFAENITEVLIKDAPRHLVRKGLGHAKRDWHYSEASPFSSLTCGLGAILAN